MHTSNHQSASVLSGKNPKTTQITQTGHRRVNWLVSIWFQRLPINRMLGVGSASPPAVHSLVYQLCFCLCVVFHKHFHVGVLLSTLPPETMKPRRRSGSFQFSLLTENSLKKRIKVTANINSVLVFHTHQSFYWSTNSTLSFYLYEL